MRENTAKSSTWASARMLSSQMPSDTLYDWALPLKSPALASCCHGFVSDLESHRALMPSVRAPSCITTPIAPASVISGRLPLRGSVGSVSAGCGRKWRKPQNGAERFICFHSERLGVRPANNQILFDLEILHPPH